MAKRRVEPCLTGKARYPTRGAAEAARRRLRLGRVYRCLLDGDYHLTTRRKQPARTQRRRKRLAARVAG